LAFFRHFTRYGAENEALLNIYWDKHKREFVVDAPEQIVTAVSVNSRMNEGYADERYIHYLDVHSHNSMPAFFSPVDDADEKATRLYAVVGRLNHVIPEIKTRISNGGKHWDIDPAEVFEPIGTAFPDEWRDKVRFRAPHTENKSKTFSRLMASRENLMSGVDEHEICAG
jgi:hypothetical protein